MIWWRDRRPFIYIAAISRSGSTMISGALSVPNHSLILSEPGFNRGYIKHISQYDQQVGPRVIRALKRGNGDPEAVVRTFRRRVAPVLRRQTPIIGVKECFHEHHELYEKYFSDVRYLVLARDPRDIYLSIEEYASRVEWFRQMWTDRGVDYVATRLNEEWQRQKRIIDTRDCVTLRYEDFCTGERAVQSVAENLGLDIDSPGDTGGIFPHHAWRLWETEKHGAGLSAKSVYRWKSMTDEAALQRAAQFAGGLPGYREYWGYE